MTEADFTKNLIQQFRSKRILLGYSQRDVDDIVGVSPGICAKWELGDRKPSLFLAYCWAEALEMNIVLEDRK